MAMQTPGFCASCWLQLDFIIEPYCALCGNPMRIESRVLCRSCLNQTLLLNSHRSLWLYGPLSRRIIFSLKHGRQRYLADLMAPWMVPLVWHHPIDCIIPVPLHPKRLAKRGFNQSALLAKAIGRLTGIPVMYHGLSRLFKTESQGRFSAQQRKDNVMGVFSSTLSWNHQKIMLIDDVFTTGATLNACAYALRQSGAHHVHAVTIAKVPDGS